MQSERILKSGMNILLITAGTFLVALAVELFIIPYSILSGGAAGIAVALSPLIHADETLIANIIVLCLLFLGRIVQGRQFFYETALSSLLYPVFTGFCLKFLSVPQVDPILASFYGGLVGGIGVGMVMRTGASTGGMDIPPMIINKLTGIRLPLLVGITDALTVALGFAAYDLSAVLLGLISVFATSLAISRVFSIGEGSVSKSVQIISENWQDIYQCIDRRLSRGATILSGYGAYRMEEKKVLLCVVSLKQYAELLQIIDECDPKAFVITTDATDMHGEGFTYGFRL